MGSLIDESDSVLVVVDAQPGFLGKLGDDHAAALAGRIAWLVRLAVALEIPIVVTEEEPDRNERTADVIVRALPDGVERHVKPTFGLAGSAPILADVERHGRRAAVVCGLETDVCVAQSALGLRDAGFRVVAVEDAVGAAGDAHEQGLRRMIAMGVELIGVKGLCYEWLRTVARSTMLDDILSTDPPPGVVL
jgi:nicotinamidase-related amidase